MAPKKTTSATPSGKRTKTRAAPVSRPPSEHPLPKAVSNRSKRKLDQDNTLTITNGTKRRKDSGPKSTTDNDDAERVATSTIKSTSTKRRAILSRAPTQQLDIYVFGGNSAGELGLGTSARSGNVTRPRLNPNLDAATVGVVQVAAGGMHCAALTHDNKILTWGVNDLGALGRDTDWDGALVDIEDDDDDESDAELNPREATPTEVNMSSIPKGTVFTQVVAGDNATFALTDNGLVYGWGTFRGNEGILGFAPDVKIQSRPTLIPNLEKVTKLAAGNNHVVALASDGYIIVWGSGQQNQLGRRVLDRLRLNSLIPRKMGQLKQIVGIAAGADHSFAIQENGSVYAWGLNTFGQTGIPENAGEDEAVTPVPTIVESLKRFGKVTHLAGGNHHSIAVTDKSECIVWGRIDNCATGLQADILPSQDIIYDSRSRPRILHVPTKVPGLNAAHVAAGSDHCITTTTSGKAYSWGFNCSGQTGQGSDDDVAIAKIIDHHSTRGKKLVWAGAGGQYGILAGEAALAKQRSR